MRIQSLASSIHPFSTSRLLRLLISAALLLGLVGSGLATGWNPGVDSAMDDLALFGGVVYAGGGFSTIGGQSRYCLAALDATTGDVQGWDRELIFSVSAILTHNGQLYTGGWFTSAGGLQRSGLAVYETNLVFLPLVRRQ